MTFLLAATRRLLYILGLLTLAWCARAAEPVTCALIPDSALGLRDSATLQMLGIELARQPGLALLEREELDRLLKERSLQSALLAEGVEARRSLGTLLKARLLVILRAGEKQVGPKRQRFIDVAVSETESGLRLSQEQLPWDDAAPEALCAPVAAQVGRAVRTLAEPVRAILAVPPFLSDDLEHRFDSMREAYPTLLMESLGQVPGLRLAELAEAQALADEIRLSSGEKIGRALLPYYLHGRYRNEGLDPARKVKLTLELTRGEQPIERRTLDSLAPEAAASALRQVALELLGKGLTLRPSAFNAGAESAELARKVRQFERLGDWAEALTLAEAALLLKPAWPEMRAKAIEFSTALINASHSGDEDVRRALALNHRALDHLALYLRQTQWTEINPTYELLVRKFLEAGSYEYGQAMQQRELAPLVQALGRAKHEMLLEWVEYVAAHPELGERYALQTDVSVNTPFTETPAERRQTQTRLIKACWTRSRGMDVSTIWRLGKTKLGDPAEEDALVQTIAALPGRHYTYLARAIKLDQSGLEPRRKLEAAGALLEEISAATLDRGAKRDLIQELQTFCGKLEEKLEAEAGQDKTAQARQYAPAGPRPTATPTPPPPAGADYALEPITLPQFQYGPQGWIKTGDGVDLLWDQFNICALQSGGESKQLYRSYVLQTVITDEAEFEARRKEGPLSEVVYDGRYVWAKVNENLMALEVASGVKRWVEPKDGLPPGEVKLAPLGPGRVCVVGSFGRAWAATVEWTGAGQAKVDVFLEARLVKGEWNDPLMAFQPRFAAALPGADGHPRVLVGREMAGRGYFHPLLLDPDRRRAEVLPERLSPRVSNLFMARQDDGFYGIVGTRDVALRPDQGGGGYDEASKPRPYLARWGAPDYRERVVFNNIPTSSSIFTFPFTTGFHSPMAGFVDGQCILFLDKFWLLDSRHDRLVQLKGETLPGRADCCQVFPSNVYGTVLLSSGKIWAFRLRRGVPGELLGMTPPAAGGRRVAGRDPIEGTPILLRKYQLKDSTHYTTLTAPLWCNAVAVEREDLTSRTVIVMFSEDQPSPAARRLLKDNMQFFSNYGYRGAFSYAEGAPTFLTLGQPPAQGKPQPLVFTFTDALGRPLAGAEVRPSFRYTDRLGMGLYQAATRDLSSFALELPMRLTDDKGRLEMALPPSLNIANPEFLVRHADYGEAYCQMARGNRMPASLVMGASGMPAMPQRPLADAGADVTIQTPLVRRASPEARSALRGQVVDGHGRPLAGARVSGFYLPRGTNPAQGMMNFSNPLMMVVMNAMQAAAISGPDGRFTFFPRDFPSGPAGPGPLPAGCHVMLHVEHPARPELGFIDQDADNRSEVKLVLSAATAPHTFAFVDESGKPLSVAEVKPEIRRFRIPLLSGAEPDTMIFDGRAGAALPRELQLSPGTYSIYSRPLQASTMVEVTTQSPRELVVRFQTRPGRGAYPSPQQLPMVGGGARIALSFAGEVRHALTGKPMAGVYVLSQTGLGGHRRDEEPTPEEWRALHDWQGPFENTASGPLKPLAEIYGKIHVTRTDAQGRFVLPCKAWERVSSVLAIEENYLACSSFVLDLGATSGTTLMLPTLKMHPAGKLAVLARTSPGPAPAPRFQIRLRYAFADPAREPWQTAFAAWGPGARTNYLYSATLRFNKPETLRVPAGVRFKLTLVPQEEGMPLADLLPPGKKESWGPWAEREVEVAPGATADLGEIEFHKLTPEEAGRQAAALEATPTPTPAPTPTPESKPGPLPAPAVSIPASPTWEQAWQYFDDEQWAEAREAMTRYGSDHMGTPKALEARLIAITCLGKLKHFDEFEREAARFEKDCPPDSPCRPALEYDRAWVTSTRGRWAESAARFQDYLNRHPDGEHACLAMFGRGKALLEQSKAARQAGSEREAVELETQAFDLFKAFREKARAVLAGPDERKKDHLPCRIVDTLGLEQDYPAVVAAARELLPRVRPASRDWAGIMNWLGCGLTHQNPPDYRAAAEAFDAILKADLPGRNQPDSMTTVAAYWRGIIAQSQGDRATVEAMITRLNVMPEGSIKKAALKRLGAVR